MPCEKQALWRISLATASMTSCSLVALFFFCVLCRRNGQVFLHIKQYIECSHPSRMCESMAKDVEWNRILPALLEFLCVLELVLRCVTVWEIRNSRKSRRWMYSLTGICEALCVILAYSLKTKRLKVAFQRSAFTLESVTFKWLNASLAAAMLTLAAMGFLNLRPFAEKDFGRVFISITVVCCIMVIVFVFAMITHALESRLIDLVVSSETVSSFEGKTRAVALSPSDMMADFVEAMHVNLNRKFSAKDVNDFRETNQFFLLVAAKLSVLSMWDNVALLFGCVAIICWSVRSCMSQVVVAGHLCMTVAVAMLSVTTFLAASSSAREYVALCFRCDVCCRKFASKFAHRKRVILVAKQRQKNAVAQISQKEEEEIEEEVEDGAKHTISHVELVTSTSRSVAKKHTTLVTVGSSSDGSVETTSDFTDLTPHPSV